MLQTFQVPAVPGVHGRPRRWLVALLAALALGMIIETQAATTWTVCASGCDYASIKMATAASTTVDGDTLAIGAGTYTEAGIVVEKNLTLHGERAATSIVQADTTRDRDTATDRVFTIPSGVTAILQDLTIRYGRFWGYSSGGGLHNSGILTLMNSTVSDNSTYAGGLDNRG